MPLPFTVRRTDPDAAAFCARSGASDRAAVSAFVRGVKDLGLWESMVCWPLRSEQNAGTGDTVYSLGGLGTFNGTRVNGPAWTADGINFALQSQGITTNYSAALTDMAAVCVYKTTADKDNFGRLLDKNFDGGMWMGRGGVTANAFGGTIAEFTGQQYVTLADEQRHFLLMTRSGTTHSVFGNGEAVTNVATKSSTATTTDPLLIGGGGVGQRGTTSLAAIFNVGVSSAQNASLYTLYRATLGTGLGLP
jgi:hypothetical protein